jgi:putative molybdopterin biosynthesis protein
MQTRIQNQLSTVRRSRGVGAADLARRVGVSRQTIYAIEAGTYVPNTEVTLHLARELEVTVEELFSLPGRPEQAAEPFPVELLTGGTPCKGQPVRIGRIGTSWISVPVSAAPYYFPESDGVISRPSRGRGKADVVAFNRDETFQKRLILAGCDPATHLVARMAEKSGGVEVVAAAASSKLALRWLKEGKAHIAGSHLEDPATGEFNLPIIRRQFGEDFTAITFAHWEQGWVTAPGNPKQIRKAEDLAGRNVLFTNRESGSGSRVLLDKLLKDSGVPTAKVRGYDRIAHGHLAAAYTVVSREADCCLATRSAAQAFGLDFVPLHSERYDLVMRKETLDLPAAQAFLDILQRSALRRMLETVAGYDTAQTGTVLV